MLALLSPRASTPRKASREKRRRSLTAVPHAPKDNELRRRASLRESPSPVRTSATMRSTVMTSATRELTSMMISQLLCSASISTVLIPKPSPHPETSALASNNETPSRPSGVVDKTREHSTHSPANDESAPATAVPIPNPADFWPCHTP